jgi:hypothetical protein
MCSSCSDMGVHIVVPYRIMKIHRQYSTCLISQVQAELERLPPAFVAKHTQQEIDLIRDDLYDRETKQRFYDHLQEGMPEYDERGDMVPGSAHSRNLLHARLEYERDVATFPTRARSETLQRLYQDVLVISDIRNLLAQKEEHDDDPLGTAEQVLAIT